MMNQHYFVSLCTFNVEVKKKKKSLGLIKTEPIELTKLFFTVQQNYNTIHLNSYYCLFDALFEQL